MEINGNQWKSMEIYEIKKSMKIKENQWNSVETIENDFKSMKDNFVLMFMKISIMYFEIDENGYKIRKNFSLFAIK